MRRAIMIPGFCALLFGLMWLLVSCTLIRSDEIAPVTEIPESASITGTAELGPIIGAAMTSSVACEETVIQTDLTTVSQNPNLDHHLVYWTWHMNFLEFDDPETQRHPLGCFRLYARAQGGDMFQEVDQGGIIITACEVISDVTFDTFTPTYAVRSQNIVPPPAVTGRATFTNGGHIVCSNFSVRTLAEYIEQNYGVPSNLLPGLSQLTGEETQVYDSLTMVATGYVSDTETTNPVVSYQPTDEKALVEIAAGLRTDPKVEFSLPSVYPPAFTFSALLDDDQYTPLDQNSPECTFLSEEDHFWWMDFAGYRNEPEKLLFLKHRIGDPPPTFPTRIEPDKCISTTSVPEVPDTITFWTGESAIYIGCKWNQGECDSTFTGVLYSVLIDPLDSKTQSD